MKVEVEKSKCIGSGQCVLIAGEVFDQDDEGIVVLLDDEPDERLRDAVQESALICPANAIRVLQ